MALAQDGYVLATAVVFFALAVLFIAGFGAPYWVATTAEFLMFDSSDHVVKTDSIRVSRPWLHVNFGLWQACEQLRGCHYWTNDKSLPVAMKAAQGFMILGLLTLLAAMVTYVWWLFREWRPVPRRLALALTIITGACGLLAVMIFGSEYGKYVVMDGWAYVNTAICSTCLLVLGIVSSCTLCRHRIEEPERLEAEKLGTDRPGSNNPGYVGSMNVSNLPSLAQTPGDLPALDQSMRSESSLTGFGLRLSQHRDYDKPGKDGGDLKDVSRSSYYTTPSQSQRESMIDSVSQRQSAVDSQPITTPLDNKPRYLYSPSQVPPPSAPPSTDPPPPTTPAQSQYVYNVPLTSQQPPSLPSEPPATTYAPPVTLAPTAVSPDTQTLSQKAPRPQYLFRMPPSGEVRQPPRTKPPPPAVAPKPKMTRGPVKDTEI